MTPKELFESVGRSGIRKMHPGNRRQRCPGEGIAGGWEGPPVRRRG
jgi:hypothetical protein